ncbi:glycosyltransferase [Moheibacter sediminis]|uniref:Glycosyltransferase involved in cell wall bisynthesis n=1 Tax=Moheibacter sediminis TaxID=1434700 RepID=A0A1W2C5A1_9FLAO|nr:glycosyltransferase [Moheibacter sediminis]SMC80052.1 Glycosyltransferase involved in cell wall bisynthesis [Moheibacter sediminis]
MNKRKIIASVINNYEGDQRVQKVCNSLQKFGFDVEVIASDLRGKPALNFPYKIHTLHMTFREGMQMYADFNCNLFIKLLQISKKGDILLANDLDALLPNYLVSKIKGLDLVFDSHEIFSEVPTLHNRKFKKSIWKNLEKLIVPKINHFYTVSNGYADWFQNEYKIRPEVIRNVPVVKPLDYDLTVNLPEIISGEKILLYQGDINFSRGIDKMIKAMGFINNAKLWIVGKGPKKDEFEKLAQELNLSDKVKFIGSVPPAQLKLITPKADLGLSLEEDYGISYRYALPNKIFDYTHAKIPILGTNLPEIKNTIETYGIGKTIENHNPKHIAEMIGKMLDEGKTPYLANLEKAAEIFNWEIEELKLQEIYSVFL